MLCVIKALGLQVKIQIFATLNILVLGTALAYHMAITNGLGINGLWYGEFFGFFANLIVYCLMVYKADWHAISEQCQIEQATECKNLDKLIGDHESLISDTFDEVFSK